jgi:hypothetical protein
LLIGTEGCFCRLSAFPALVVLSSIVRYSVVRPALAGRHVILQSLIDVQGSDGVRVDGQGSIRLSVVTLDHI